MKSRLPLEGMLQKRRFAKALPYVKGETLLDFGGNNGELKRYVKQQYFICNRDYSVLSGRHFDTICALAVIEHLPKKKVFEVMAILAGHLSPAGRLIITTPTRTAKVMLETLASIGLLDKANMREHRHYWTRKELYELARSQGLSIIRYEIFQLGLNQLLVMEKKNG